MTPLKFSVRVGLCALSLCGLISSAHAQKIEDVQQKSFQICNLKADRVAGWLQKARAEPQAPRIHQLPAVGSWPAVTVWRELPRLPGNGNGPLLHLPEGIQSVSADESTNSLLVSGDAAGLAALEKLLPSLDVPLVQYEIEARFYDVGREELPKLGLKFWEAPAKTMGGSVALAPVGCEANLQKLADQKRAVLLTSPRVTVFDGVPSEIKQTRSQPISLENASATQTPPVANVPPLGSASIQSEIGVVATATRRENNGITLEIEANLQTRHLKSSATLREDQTLALKLTPANEKRQIVVLVTARKVRRVGD